MTNKTETPILVHFLSDAPSTPHRAMLTVYSGNPRFATKLVCEQLQGLDMLGAGVWRETAMSAEACGEIMRILVDQAGKGVEEDGRIVFREGDS